MGKEITETSINDLLGQPTDISCIDEGSKKDFSRVVFNLYRETVTVAVVSSHLYGSYNLDEDALPRDQAIGAGLLIRIAKFMKSIMALLCDKVGEHGEVIMALNRCISESAMNLRFFCERATSQDFDNFVRSSLKPEKEQYFTVQKNIKERGKILPIEERILNSINNVLVNSGIEKIDDLDSIPRWKDYKSILASLGLESYYNALQGISSHSIHGSWVDLILHHLEKNGIGFRPKPDSITPDARLLCSINIIVLEAIRSYISKYFLEYGNGISTLLTRIDDLIKRNTQVDSLHEKQLSRNKKIVRKKQS